MDNPFNRQIKLLVLLALVFPAAAGAQSGKVIITGDRPRL
jgi:hypothetical protein